MTVVEDPNGYEIQTMRQILSEIGCKEFLTVGENERLKNMAYRRNLKQFTLTLSSDPYEHAKAKPVTRDNPVWTGSRDALVIFRRIKKASISLIEEEICSLEQKIEENVCMYLYIYIYIYIYI